MRRAVLISPSKVKPLERIRVRQLLSRKSNLDAEQMHWKLSKLDTLILLKDKSRIVGVSTLKKFRFRMNGQNVLGILNDESVSEGESTHVGRAFYRYIWKEKLLHPFTPVFWISIDPVPGGVASVLQLASEETEGAIPISESIAWRPPKGRAYFGRFRFWKVLGLQLAMLVGIKLKRLDALASS